MSTVKVRCLLALVGALLFLQASPGRAATFVIDPKLGNIKEVLPGLDGGPPRSIAVVVDPTQQLTEVVANEILIHPRDEKELDVFVSRYGGKILRDGMPVVPPNLPKGHPPIESDGWYLVRIDPSLSPLDDLEKSLGAGKPDGEYRFSTEDAARLFALLLREQDFRIEPNLVLRPQFIPEHPDGMGGNLDASTFWWLNEDDDPMMPGNQGLSIGVVHAWDYLRYQGLPPQNGSYRPARIAIIDGGFALSETGDGAPLDNNLDYGIGMTQWDVVNHDPYAGGPNPMQCAGSPCPWHGQSAFAVAAAEPGNHFGGAGTGGKVVWPLLLRTIFDSWSLSDAIRIASLSESDVISMSLKGGCHPEWLCRIPPDDDYSRIERAVLFARSYGQVVVAAAGNEGVEISGDSSYPVPCNITGVMCVGAVNHDGMNVFNFGSAVDIWAPTGILSTVTPASRARDADDVGEDEVAGFGGTSCSTPFIAGVVGLMKALDHSISPQSVQDILQMTANPSPDPRVHRGWVDAFRAVQAVRPNQPPVVQWTAPASGPIPWTGALLSVQASDPEVDPANAWQWPMTVSFSSNINGPLCTDSTPPYGCFSGPLALGNHVITATATDAFGATSSVTRNFQSTNQPPVPDIAAPVTNGTYFAHQLVTLEAFILDPEEHPFPQNGVVWSSNVDGVLGIGWSRDVMLSAGAHVITVRATDGRGATGQDSVNITVQPGTGLPFVQILEPGPDLSVTPGTQITLRGSATDPEDGALTGSSVVWFSDRDGQLGTGQEIHVVLSGPAVPCHSEIVTHTITLRATDSNGHVVSVTLRISVGQVC